MSARIALDKAIKVIDAGPPKNRSQRYEKIVEEAKKDPMTASIELRELHTKLRKAEAELRAEKNGFKREVKRDEVEMLRYYYGKLDSLVG